MIVERVLAALALALALGAAWAESGSELAARIRDARPWAAWLEAREPVITAVPSFHLAVYDPARRRLSVLHLPGSLRLEGRRTLERVYLDALKASGSLDDAARAAEDLAAKRLAELSPEPLPAPSARLQVRLAPLAAQDEPSVEASRALKARARSPRAWLSLLRGPLDSLLLAVELRRVPVESLRPAVLPEDAAAVELLGSILSGEDPPPGGKATTAEVLNATDEPGLASRASKMLRLKGVDVMAMGRARMRARTLVYDRAGDFGRAAEARAALPCPSARVVTRLDPSRAVDVSVELGDDCKETTAWNSSKY